MKFFCINSVVRLRVADYTAKKDMSARARHPH